MSRPGGAYDRRVSRVGVSQANFGYVLGAMAVLMLVSCGGTGARAEVVDVPLRAKLTPAASAWHPRHCKNQSCLVGYGIRVTNEGDRGVYVLECRTTLIDANGVTVFTASLPIGEPAGIYVPAGATRVGSGGVYLHIAPSLVQTVMADRTSCQALDWHGNPPI